MMHVSECVQCVYAHHRPRQSLPVPSQGAGNLQHLSLLCPPSFLVGEAGRRVSVLTQRDKLPALAGGKPRGKQQDRLPAECCLPLQTSVLSSHSGPAALVTAASGLPSSQALSGPLQVSSTASTSLGLSPMHTRGPQILNPSWLWANSYSSQLWTLNLPHLSETSPLPSPSIHSSRSISFPKQKPELGWCILRYKPLPT